MLIEPSSTSSWQAGTTKKSATYLGSLEASTLSLTLNGLNDISGDKQIEPELNSLPRKSSKPKNMTLVRPLSQT